MPDPAEDCKEYHTKIERSIDNLLAINKELSWDNQLLQEEINNLRTEQKPGLTYDQQYLIDVVAQNVAIWRVRYDTLPNGIQEIIKAYDKAASGQEKETEGED